MLIIDIMWWLSFVDLEEMLLEAKVPDLEIFPDNGWRVARNASCARQKEACGPLEARLMEVFADWELLGSLRRGAGHLNWVWVVCQGQPVEASVDKKRIETPQASNPQLHTQFCWPTNCQSGYLLLLNPHLQRHNQRHLFHACGPRSHRVSSHSVSPPKHQTCRQRGLKSPAGDDQRRCSNPTSFRSFRSSESTSKCTSILS